jgi:hypothetical protein
MKINKYWKTAFYINSELSKKNVEYSIIKSYRSLSYKDGNLDLVVSGDLIKFYETYLSHDFTLKDRDIFKAKYYERNKLMCTSKTSEYISIHLHANVGWHDHEFFSYDKIMEMSERKIFSNGEVILCKHEFEAEILFIHAFFEKHEFSSLDIEFIGQKDLQKFFGHYLGSIHNNEWVKEDHRIPLSKLFKVWRRYYSKSKRANIKNIFFHLMLLIRQIFQK